MIFNGSLLAERLSSLGDFLRSHQQDVNPVVAAFIDKASAWSALAVPTAVRRDGLPLGVCLLAAPGAERLLIREGQKWENYAIWTLVVLLITVLSEPFQSAPAVVGQAISGQTAGSVFLVCLLPGNPLRCANHSPWC